jgi:hypothetical protein
MALDSFGGIKSISVPAWLKLAIFAIVAAVLVADFAIVWNAARNPNHKDWFAPAFSLLATLVPLLLAILLLAFSTRGTDAITRRTRRLLLDLVPKTIVSSLTWNPEFQSLEKARWSGGGPDATRIMAAHRAGDFCCLYRILFCDPQAKQRELFLVVELKVRQANMHLCVPREAFDNFCRQTGKSGWEAFEAAFHATLSGAVNAGCVVNQATYQLSVAQSAPQTAVVVYRKLTDDFFTDASEQLFWAQDMVTMLKGFTEEGLDGSQPLVWFPEVRA